MKQLFFKFLVAFLLTSAVVLSWSEYFCYRAFAKTVCHCLLAYDLTMQYPIRNCMEVFPPPDLIFRLL